MVNPLIYQHIYRKSKQLEITIPNNVNDILNQYKNINGFHILFLWLWDCGGKCLNANSIVYKTIIINAEWAARLVLFDDEETKNTFKNNNRT